MKKKPPSRPRYDVAPALNTHPVDAARGGGQKTYANAGPELGPKGFRPRGDRNQAPPKSEMRIGTAPNPPVGSAALRRGELLEPAREKPKIRWETTHYPLAKRRPQRGDANGEKNAKALDKGAAARNSRDNVGTHGIEGVRITSGST